MMRIRNKNRKFVIDKIFIEKDPYGGVIVSYIVRGQYIEQHVPYPYLDSILNQVLSYMTILADSCDDSYIMKK